MPKTHKTAAVQNINFLTKKRIILLIFFAVLTALLLFVNFNFILDINWRSFGSTIRNSFHSHPIATFIFLACFSHFIFTFMSTYVVLTIRLKQLKVANKIGDNLFYSLVIAFVTFISPQGIFRCPYTIFYLRTKGLTNTEASALYLCDEIVSMTAWVIFNTPAFIFMMCYSSTLVTTGTGITLLILVIVGYLWDFVTLGLLILFSMNKEIQYVWTLGFNKLKKILHISYSTKQEIKKSIQRDRIVQSKVHEIFVNYKNTAIVFGLKILMLFFGSFIFSLVFLFMAQGTTDVESVDFGKVFLLLNESVLSTRFAFFIPQGNGSTELALQQINKYSGQHAIGYIDGAEEKQFVSNSILLWRFFYSYFSGILGLPFFFILFVKQLKTFRINK